MKKKLLAVLKAAVLGGVIAELMILAVNIAYMLWVNGKPSGLLKNLTIEFGMLLTLPAALLSNANGLANGWVVNGVLGAIAFGLAAILWQFVWKSSDNDDRQR